MAPSPDPQIAAPRRRRRRRWLAVVGVLAVVLAAAYAAYWHALRERVLAEVESWTAARQAEGWGIAHAPIETSGFPATLSLRFERPLVRAPRADDTWDWQGERVVVDIDPLDPRHVSARAFGEQRFAVTAGGREARFAISGAELGGEVRVVRGGERGEFRGRDVVILPAEGEPVRIRALRVQGRRPETDGTEIAVAADGVDLPAAAASPLGRRIERFVLDGALFGEIGAPLGPAAVQAWRDAGGVLRIDRLAIDYGPLSAGGEGRLAIDAAGRPEGELTARVTGAGAAIDALAAAEAIGWEAALAARFATSALSRMPEGGGEPILEAPIRIRDGRLSVGPAALLSVPAIPWAARGGR